MAHSDNRRPEWVREVEELEIHEKMPNSLSPMAREGKIKLLNGLLIHRNGKSTDSFVARWIRCGTVALLMSFEKTI